MRISDWSSDVCSSDLLVLQAALRRDDARFIRVGGHEACRRLPDDAFRSCISKASPRQGRYGYTHPQSGQRALGNRTKGRSEEHTSELQSLMRNSYAVFCLQKRKI